MIQFYSHFPWKWAPSSFNIRSHPLLSTCCTKVTFRLWSYIFSSSPFFFQCQIVCSNRLHALLLAERWWWQTAYLEYWWPTLVKQKCIVVGGASGREHAGERLQFKVITIKVAYIIQYLYYFIIFVHVCWPVCGNVSLFSCRNTECLPKAEGPDDLRGSCVVTKW